MIAGAAGPGRFEPRHVPLGDVGSTNDEAMTRLEADGVEVWVTAERQLTGRGRRGRTWASEPGNLYASLAFPCALEGAAFGILPLAAAVALADGLATLGLSVQLKWPNDVLLDGAKTAGILVESTVAGASRRVVIGFGVNVAHHPAGDDHALPPTHLALHRSDLDAEAVFAALRPAVATTLARLAAADGVAAIRARWLDRAVGLGRPIGVRFAAEERHGTFAGLDPDGRLLLATPEGRIEAVAAADVFLRSAA